MYQDYPVFSVLFAGSVVIAAFGLAQFGGEIIPGATQNGLLMGGLVFAQWVLRLVVAKPDRSLLEAVRVFCAVMGVVAATTWAAGDQPMDVLRGLLVPALACGVGCLAGWLGAGKDRRLGFRLDRRTWIIGLMVVALVAFLYDTSEAVDGFATMKIIVIVASIAQLIDGQPAPVLRPKLLLLLESASFAIYLLLIIMAEPDAVIWEIAVVLAILVPIQFGMNLLVRRSRGGVA